MKEGKRAFHSLSMSFAVKRMLEPKRLVAFLCVWNWFVGWILLRSPSMSMATNAKVIAKCIRDCSSILVGMNRFGVGIEFLCYGRVDRNISLKYQ
ncbi:hypothetical protein NPIL_530171 [Nephila pilipes]|uniref:Uncharacterized protein n=1 Tax=Nephila pilipes TaxID=299642 RepID=A0A8X6MQW3_NEPPI|nr:hypothetical protein NPIL_530171 [Nephila pilipes]